VTFLKFLNGVLIKNGRLVDLVHVSHLPKIQETQNPKHLGNKFKNC
jgi:hypothetical protein